MKEENGCDPAKELTYPIVETLCNYYAYVAGATFTSLDVKTHLRKLGYYAEQHEVAEMVRFWANENNDEVIAYTTYSMRR
jgi:hypothetical protein